MPDAPRVPTVDASRRPSPLQRPSPRGALLALGAVVGVAVPTIRAVGQVRGATRLQYNDYWPMILDLLGPNRELDVGAVFELRNEHPIAIPKLLYWVNVRLFDGSNTTLGIVVVLVALASVALVALLARATDEMGPVHVAVVTVVAAVLLFSPRGTWYFVKAMSGAAWLTANALVVAAVVARVRRQRLLAVGLAVAASLSYGTGLAVWPAILVAGLLVDRKVLAQWPAVVVGAVTLGWYANEHRQIPENVWVVEPSLVERVETSLMTVGAFVRPYDGGLTTALGAIILALGAAAAALVAWGVWRARPTGADPAAAVVAGPSAGACGWVGLWVAAVAAAVLLSGTNRFSVSVTESRYAIIGAMVLLSTVGLVVTILAPRAATAGRTAATTAARVGLVCVVLVGVVVGLRGGEVDDVLQRTRSGQDLLEVAFQLDFAGGTTYWQGGLETMPVGIEDRLRETGHIPFDGSETLGCGLVGHELDPDDLDAERPLPGQVDAYPLRVIDDADFLSGQVDVGDGEVQCLVVTADTTRVRGSGGFGPKSDGFGTGRESAEGRVFFDLIARRAEALQVWARLEGEDVFRPVGDPVGT